MTAVIPRKKEHGGGVSLPEDIVFDVLTRLPAKALCRFTCVCKGWRALVSDPAFVAAQRCRAGPHLVAVFCGALEARVMDMEGNVIRAFKLQVLGKDDGTDVGMIQQPTTICVLGRRILQPDTGICPHAKIIDLAAGHGHAYAIRTDNPLAFSSFGRAALSGTFKILFVAKTLDQPLVCCVATIPHGSAEPPTWRQRSVPPFAIIVELQEKRATVNGIVYFMPKVHRNSGSTRLAAFDLESEEWNMINGPSFGIQEEAGYANVTLTELRGTLGVVQTQQVPNHDHYYVNVWLLIDSSKSVWEKEYSIQMPKTWGWPKQFWALDDGRILFLVSESVINYSPRHVLIFYDPSTNAFTRFRDIEILHGDTLVLYTGSLLC